MSQVVTGSSGTILFSCDSAGAAIIVTSAGSVIPQFSLQSPYSSLAISSTRCASAVTLTSGVSVVFGAGSGTLPITSYNYCARFSRAPSTGLASFTMTWSSPSASAVTCGHNQSCSVQSNSTISNIRFAGNTIHVEANGLSGAHGYANVTVPKSNVPHIETLHVFVNNSKLSSSDVTITSNSTDYFIYFTFTFHSPVLIDIQLTSPENAASPSILGQDPTIFYVSIGGAVSLIAVASAAIALKRRKATL